MGGSATQSSKSSRSKIRSAKTNANFRAAATIVVIVLCSLGDYSCSASSYGAVTTPRRTTTQKSRNATPFTAITSSTKATEIADYQKRALLQRGGDDSVTVGFAHRLKVVFYFSLWYALNVVYNILNKKLLNVVPAPVTIGTLQLFVGSSFCALLWLTRLRARPTLTPSGRTMLQRVGLSHSAGQLLSMVSLGAGPVSFTHIVKALEPLFSAVVSALTFGTWMAWPVYASLVPVVGGVGYACMKERSFSWLAFYTAMGSNLAFAFRAVLSKMVMTGNADNAIGTNMSSANTFGLVTIFASVISIPCVLLGDGRTFASVWKKATTAVLTSEGVAEGAAAAVVTVHTSRSLIQAVLVSGLFHYLNNEVMYLALSNVHPVTLAVGNTMKRVFIMVASIIVFRNPISLQAGIGSAVGITGVLLYSLTKQHYEKLEAATA